MEKIGVVIPTYNEAGNIEALVEQIFSLGLPMHILVVDDNSRDGTGIIAERLKKKHQNKLSVIHRSGKLGLGSAYTTGFTWMLEHIKPDIIISMDADFSHDPKNIPNFIKKIHEGYDVVVGTRYRLGGGSNQPWHRIMISRAANWLTNFVLGLEISDTTGSFRCYKREVIEQLPLNKIEPRHFSFLPQILYYCKKNNCKIAEVPIYYVDRKKGQSKRSISQVINSFFAILKVRLK